MSGGGSKKGGQTVASEKTNLANPITFYLQKTGSYPSNAQVWWAMKRPPEMGTDRPPKQYLEVFDPSLRYQISTGNTPVAKGHFVLDAFFQDRSHESGVSGLDVVSSLGSRPAAVAFFAGRVFYAGVFSANFNTKIYFSQILERPQQVQECYQAADPTAEDIRDLLPSDGGVIVIPEVVRVHNLVPVGDSLFVFASNGVWRISGSEGVGFRANDYSVSKLSGTPTISSVCFVTVEGLPIWWNRSSINTLAPDQRGQLQVQSLTDASIKSFLDDIPEQSKFYAKGAYDPVKRRVQFLYRSTETDDDSKIFNYDRVLNLDTRSGAWYPWSLPEGRVDVKGVFALQGQSVEQSIERVVVNTDDVIADTSDVYTVLTFRKVVDSKLKYIVNVKDETNVPEPPDPADTTVVREVFVSDSDVQAGTSNVVVTESTI